MTTEEKNPETRRIEYGMAEYLEQFDRSPYSYPACDYTSVEGVSTLKGSWFQKKPGEPAAVTPDVDPSV